MIARNSLSALAVPDFKIRRGLFVPPTLPQCADEVPGTPGFNTEPPMADILPWIGLGITAACIVAVFAVAYAMRG